jgi:hypothetical protein
MKHQEIAWYVYDGDGSRLAWTKAETVDGAISRWPSAAWLRAKAQGYTVRRVTVEWEE